MKPRVIRLCLALSLVLALAACGGMRQDRRAADAAAVRQVDADWAAAAQTKQVASWVAFYADDAVVLPANGPMATNKDQIRQLFTGLLGLPNLSINWQTTGVDVARSGELAYTYGTYTLAFDDRSGKRIADRGKYAEFWKKQADGGWKCVLDIWNSDLPAGP